MYKYQLVDISTEEGLKEAETLKENGWKIIGNGFFTIQFEKEIDDCLKG